jgi:hypothetical protein
MGGADILWLRWMDRFNQAWATGDRDWKEFVKY